ncbi:hypothetical protein EDC01DRAFT_603423, partial [Geopyxis carbonaria]
HVADRKIKPHQEQELVTKYLDQDDRGAPPKHSRVQSMASDSVKDEEKKKDCAIVGHPTDQDRLLAMDKREIIDYFIKLRDCITKDHILPEDMWNFD